MKRLRVVVLLATVALLMLSASPAGAKSYSMKSPEAAACLIAAVTWDGSSTSSTQVITDLVVRTKPFPELAVGGEKKLQRILRKLAKDSQDIIGVAELGKWCKAHFPKVSTIRKSSFEIGV